MLIRGSASSISGIQILAAQQLPFTSGVGTLGDATCAGDGFAAIHGLLDGKPRIFLFSLGGTQRVDRTTGHSASFSSEPPLRRDGTDHAIASSTNTQAELMKVDELGSSVVASFGLPDIPSGGRTAAYRIGCRAD